MDLKLNNRTVLITGATKGIGRAIAEALVREGAQVIINARSVEEVNEVTAELSEHGEVHAAAADVGDAEGVKSLLDAAADVGDVDILINNVSTFEVKEFGEISDEEWATYFQVNIMSGVRLSRALLPGMMDRGWGRILFISSESGVNIDENMLQYSMTKTAQIGLARGIAQIAADSGVTVNSVLPGPTWTEGVEQFLQKIAEQEGTTIDDLKEHFVARERPSSLIRRFAEPEEVAALVAFLCSPHASAISGAPCRVDGGVVPTCF